jgi:hypothetical protein
VTHKFTVIADKGYRMLRKIIVQIERGVFIRAIVACDDKVALLESGIVGARRVGNLGVPRRKDH